uniref:HTH_Tnp_Tc3_1 domain-containing protein n=1 Tax=Caenorhabditis japonica TaxID=281687 RepID=A0A8R1ISW9_CAEJA
MCRTYDKTFRPAKVTFIHLSSIITGLASILSSEEQAQLDIMTQLGFSTLQMSRRITRSRCCVRNYARDTMAHGSAKPTGRPRILNDLDKPCVVNNKDNKVFRKFPSPISSPCELLTLCPY